MDFLITPLLMLFALVFLCFYIPHYSRKTSGLTSKAASQSQLETYIKKPDRTQAHTEWSRQYTQLLRSLCLDHFGASQCNHCGLVDHETPMGCDCETLTTKSVDGTYLATFRLNNPSCKYHSKEHHFGSTAT